MARKKDKDKDKGWLAKFALAMTQAPREVAAQTGVLGRALLDPELRQIMFASTPEKAVKGLSSADLRREEEGMMKMFETFGVDKERGKRLLERSPLEAGLKSTAGLGSYFVPGGATLGGAVGRGALGGAMGGLGLSETGQEIGGMAGGAMGGAAGGGIGYGVGRGVGKLLGKGAPAKRVKIPGMKEKGVKLIEETIQPKVDITPTFALKKTALARKSVEIGLKGSPIKKSTQLGNLYNQLVNRLDDVATQSKSRAGTTDIVTDFVERAGLQVDDITKGSAGKNINVWSRKLQGLGDDAGIKDLLAVKFDVQGKLNSVYTKMAKGNPLTDADQVLWAVHGAVDDAIKLSEPATVDVLSQMSTLHKLAPGMAKAPKGAPIPLPGLTGVRTGHQTIGAAKDVLGRGMMRAGEGISMPQIPAIPQTTQAMLGDVAQRMGRTGMVSQLSGLMPGLTGAMPEEEVMDEGVMGEPSPALGSVQGQQALTASIQQMKAEGMQPGEVAQYLTQQGLSEQEIDSIMVPMGARPRAEFAGAQQPQAGFGLPEGVMKTLSTIQMLADAGVDSDLLQPLLIETLMPEQAEGEGSAAAQVSAAGYGNLLTQGTASEREEVAQLITEMGPEAYMQNMPISQLYTPKQQIAADEAAKTVSDLDALMIEFEEGGNLTGAFVGSGVARGLRSFGIGDESEAASAQAALGNFTNALIKQLSGANVTAPEEKRLAKSVPKATDSETTVLIKLENIRNKTARDEEVREGAARANMGEMQYWTQHRDELLEKYPIAKV